MPQRQRPVTEKNQTETPGDAAQAWLLLVRHRDRQVLMHQLPLAVAPLEDTSAARSAFAAVGNDPVQAPSHGQVAIRSDGEIGNVEIDPPG